MAVGTLIGGFRTDDGPFPAPFLVGSDIYHVEVDRKCRGRRSWPSKGPS